MGSDGLQGFKHRALDSSVFDRTWMVLTIIVMAVLAFAFQGSRPLFEPDEGRFTSIALQMLDSGDWWVPRLNDEQPHLAKPPLTYWLMAASMDTFGRNSWAARLPWAIAFLLTGLLVMNLAATAGFRHPWLPALMWATSLEPFAAANMVTTDTILVLFETLAVAAFVHTQTDSRHGRARTVWTLIMWLAFGLAFLTKGPPALLPLLAIVLWLVWRHPWTATRQLFHPAGLVIFAIVGLGWFASLIFSQGELGDYFLGYELADRIFTGVHDRNSDWSDVFRIYGPAMIAGSLPWLLTLRIRRSGDAAVAEPGGLERSFLHFWIWIPLAVFALSQSRLELYVLPLFVPVALLLTSRVAALIKRAPRAVLVFGVVWFAALLGLKGYAGQISQPKRDARELALQAMHAAAAMERRPERITFVERKPWYGLRLYSGLPVELVHLGAGVRPEGAVYVTDSVCQAAARPESRLWMVRVDLDDLDQEFRNMLGKCGFTAKQLGPAIVDTLPFEVLPIQQAQSRKR
jgi:4-amino-4-deoxy-L-arabinose transferase-like glycosyltransferase